MAVLLVLDAAGLWVVRQSHRPPSFRRGGAFGTASVNGVDPSPLRGQVTITSPPLDGSAPPSPSTFGAVPSPTGPRTTTGRSGPDGSAAPGAPTTAAPRTTAPSPGGPASPTMPALGIYTYAVHGEEGATGFGRRDLPDTMTMSVHGGSGLEPGEVIFDTRYSDDHSEREIIAYSPSAVAMTFEGGAVRFGPANQTNQGDYSPAMVQIPLPLAAGTTRSGATNVLDSGGNVQRIEDWTASVVGQETIPVAGTPTPTWRIRLTRQSRPGSKQEVGRSRDYWYDPSRALWVRYHEVMHAQQKMAGVTFTFDVDITADLVKYAP